MDFQGFSNDDFEVFGVAGLEPRMAALKQHLRPKLEQLGRDYEDILSESLGRPVYAHVAKHARRTVNAPNDSWVAFCHDKRGYKKHPHFQIGMWRTHAFATFGLIYESAERQHYAEQLKAHHVEVLRAVPGDYVWIPNHMDTFSLRAADVDAEGLSILADKMAQGRQGELMVGIKIDQRDAVKMSATEFEKQVSDCFRTIKPLYQLAYSEGE
jgi:uncharacterized protein YktB (UPF0637 family)